METTLRIPDQIYGQHRIINTLDNQKKRKHSSFSSELLEEEIRNRITQKKTKKKTTNGVIQIPSQVCTSYLS